MCARHSHEMTRHLKGFNVLQIVLVLFCHEKEVLSANFAEIETRYEEKGLPKNSAQINLDSPSDSNAGCDVNGNDDLKNTCGDDKTSDQVNAPQNGLPRLRDDETVKLNKVKEKVVETKVNLQFHEELAKDKDCSMATRSKMTDECPKVEPGQTSSTIPNELDDELTQQQTNLEKDKQVKEDKHLDTGVCDNGRNGNEEDTQDYSMEISSVDARQFVNYEDGDFDTDSEFEGKSQEGEKIRKQDKRNNGELQHSKVKARKTTSPAKDKCQGSSSEEDNDRPWLDLARKKKKTGDDLLKPSSFRSPHMSRLLRRWGDRDTQAYRDGYPGKKDVRGAKDNLHFYQGKIKSHPDGAYIDDIHKDWWHNHDRLEAHHGYIQWLFPIRESGMNWHAQELQLHEAEAIQSDQKALERFLNSYEMMLYFYGIRLVCRKTGKVKRADNWKPRFRHLNYSMHNLLRITRILKSLGEMGFERFKVPFLRFMLHEAIVTEQLSRTLDSCYNYWMGTVRDDTERQRLRQLADQMYEGGKEAEEEEIDVG